MALPGALAALSRAAPSAGYKGIRAEAALPHRAVFRNKRRLLAAFALFRGIVDGVLHGRGYWRIATQHSNALLRILRGILHRRSAEHLSEQNAIKHVCCLFVISGRFCRLLL